MAITEDASTPSPVSGAGTSAITTASFTPPATSLLVAMVGGGWNHSSSNLTGASVTDTVGLTWTQVALAQGTDRNNRGVSGIWVSYLPASVGTITVTASFTNLAGGRYLSVKVLNGASPTQSAVTGWSKVVTSGATTSSAEIAVNLSTVGSVVYGIVDNPQTNDAFTVMAGTTQISQYSNGVPDNITMAAWKSTAATVTTGATAFGGTFPNSDEVNVCAFEVIPAGGSGAPTLPAVPTFTDGQLVTAAQLNALSLNIANLYSIVSGGQRYAPYTPGGKGPIKPFTMLSVTNPAFVLADSTSTLVTWDTVFANSDRGWSPLDGSLILINTPGFWRLHFQAQVLAGSSVAVEMAAALLVNGTTLSGSGVAISNTYGSAVGVSASLELATNTLIYCFVEQANSGAVSTNVGLMQFTAEWLGT